MIQFYLVAHYFIYTKLARQSNRRSSSGIRRNIYGKITITRISGKISVSNGNGDNHNKTDVTIGTDSGEGSTIRIKSKGKNRIEISS